MRTKSLLLTAALIAVGAVSATAQSNVYSLNVVGYVNVPLVSGFNLIANPLNNPTSGNTLTTIFGNSLPNQSSVYKFVNGSYQSAAYLTGIGWLPDGNMTVNPGEGVFVQIPAGQSAVATFTGEVLQGNLTNTYPAGFSIISSQVPQAGGLSSVGGFAPQNMDTIYAFDSATQNYVSATYLNGIGWLPSEPSIAVGQAFFLNTSASSSWVRSFTVN